MSNRKRIRRLALVGILVCAVLLALSVRAMLAAQRLEDEKKRAHEQCKQIALAVEGYRQSPMSPSTGEQELLSRKPNLQALAKPPFGGQSYLRRGEADMFDPWGQQYRLEIREIGESEVSILASTTAPDGTPISQFGIGEKAKIQTK